MEKLKYFTNKPPFLNLHLPYVYIGRGLSREVYLVNNYVIKIQRQEFTTNQTYSYLDRLRQRYQLLEKYLGPFIPTTQLVIGEGINKGVTIIYFQPYFEGIRLMEAIRVGQEKGHDLSNIRNFFQCSLDFYQDTGCIPELMKDLPFNFLSKFFYPLYTSFILPQCSCCPKR